MINMDKIHPEFTDYHKNFQKKFFITDFLKG